MHLPPARSSQCVPLVTLGQVLLPKFRIVAQALVVPLRTDRQRDASVRAVVSWCAQRSPGQRRVNGGADRRSGGVCSVDLGRNRGGDLRRTPASTRPGDRRHGDGRGTDRWRAGYGDSQQYRVNPPLSHSTLWAAAQRSASNAAPSELLPEPFYGLAGCWEISSSGKINPCEIFRSVRPSQALPPLPLRPCRCLGPGSVPPSP